MTLGALLHSFVTDAQFKAVLGLIVLDLVLGVVAALKVGNFQLSYLANFSRNDLLGKVLPFFVLHSAAVVAGGTNVLIPGLDLSKISDGMFLLVTAAMVGSVLSSLADLGFSSFPTALAGRSKGSSGAP